LLSKLKKLKASISKKDTLSKDINYYLDYTYEIHPHSESLKIALIYVLVGGLWILLSDKILGIFVKNPESYMLIQTYKGWFYVILTTFLIYSLVSKKLFLLKSALKKIYDNFEELNSAHEELVALDEELRQQYDELDKNRNALILKEKDLNFLAFYDTLTTLPNRTSFETELNKLISDKNTQNFAVLYADIDNFKNINDTLGHYAGDLLLKHIASILKEQIHAPNFISRLSGDEFALILKGISNKEEIILQLQTLLNHLRKPWVLDSHEFFISFSIGIALYPEHGADASILLKNVDTAMYNVKKLSKDGYCFYSETLHENNLKYVTLVNELRKAVDNENFFLLYQPIVDMSTNMISGVEALIRWKHPIKGIIPPMEFIPIAEETGIIHQIGDWVLKTAFIQKKKWENEGYENLIMSINISAKRICDKTFIKKVKKLLSEIPVNCSKIQFEVTETALIENLSDSVEVLKELKAMGIKIALDDFGTGYSSLNYLKKLPIDTVKIDREFVKTISNQENNQLIIQSVIKLIHDLNLDIIAEGIETIEQLEFLKLNNCDLGQGYLFDKPISEEILQNKLLSNYIL
jgi:diguanylate cyclase (GGDEF)-like protein